MIRSFLHKFSIFLFYVFGVFLFSIYLYTINTINVCERHFLFETQPKLNYDIIIVGAGTAGLTIAAGIESSSVLIIEAGNDFTSTKTPISSIFSTLLHNIPIITPLFQLQDAFDWQYKTQPQKNGCHALVNNVSNWPMGKGFGGTQLINNMIYYRGHENDFQQWFSSSTNYNFAKDILPYFREFEHNLELDSLKFTTKLSNIVQMATKYLKQFSGIVASEFIQPYILQQNGRRWSVVDSYHRLKLKHNIALNAQVEHLLFDDKNVNHAALKAVGVSYKQGGRSYEVYASKCVILSAGTIGTPTILLKSGIGPESLYEKAINKTENSIKIKMRKNMPAVGMNLQDHVTTGLDLIILNQTLGLEPWNIYAPKHLFDYFVNGDGPLTMTGCELLAFMRTNLANESDLMPDLGFMILPMGTTIDAGVHFRRILNLNEKVWQQYFKPLISTPTISILPIVLHPKSRGFVTIKSWRNDQIKTIIDPRYLTHPHDINVLVIGLKFIAHLINTQPFKAYGAKINPKPFPGCEHNSFASDDYWKCYAKQLTLTAYHPIGTCRMGTGKSNSVIHSDTFQVHEVHGLFVCDASIMPTMPSGNPQAAVGMLARKFLHTFNKNIANDAK